MFFCFFHQFRKDCFGGVRKSRVCVHPLMGPGILVNQFPEAPNLISHPANELANR